MVVTFCHHPRQILMLAGEHTWGWNGGDVRHKGWSNEVMVMVMVIVATDGDGCGDGDDW